MRKTTKIMIKIIGSIVGHTIGFSKFYFPKIVPTIIVFFFFIISGLKQTEVHYSDGSILIIPDIKQWKVLK